MDAGPIPCQQLSSYSVSHFGEHHTGITTGHRSCMVSLLRNLRRDRFLLDIGCDGSFSFFLRLVQ